MGSGFLEACGTYLTKVNPSNTPPNPPGWNEGAYAIVVLIREWALIGTKLVR